MAEKVIDELRAENERLRIALRPLAYLYHMIDDCDADPDTNVFFQHDGCIITYGEIREAARCLVGQQRDGS